MTLGGVWRLLAVVVVVLALLLVPGPDQDVANILLRFKENNGNKDADSLLHQPSL